MQNPKKWSLATKSGDQDEYFTPTLAVYKETVEEKQMKKFTVLWKCVCSVPEHSSSPHLQLASLTGACISLEKTKLVVETLICLPPKCKSKSEPADLDVIHTGLNSCCVLNCQWILNSSPASLFIFLTKQLDKRNTELILIKTKVWTRLRNIVQWLSSLYQLQISPQCPPGSCHLPKSLKPQ